MGQVPFTVERSGIRGPGALDHGMYALTASSTTGGLARQAALKQQDLAWVSADNREEVARVLDQADRAASRCSLSHPSPFMPPAMLAS